MKPTLTPEQRKKISQVAGIIGRLGGGKNTPAQMAVRKKNGERFKRMGRERVAANMA